MQRTETIEATSERAAAMRALAASYQARVDSPQIPDDRFEADDLSAAAAEALKMAREYERRLAKAGTREDYESRRTREVRRKRLFESTGNIAYRD